MGSKPFYTTVHYSSDVVGELMNEVVSLGSGIHTAQTTDVKLWSDMKADFKDCHTAPKTDYWGATVASSGALSHRWYMMWGDYPLKRNRNDIPVWLAMGK